MSVIIFIAILAVLVFVHELGHFAAAKLSGMRVDEFGFGFPPRLFGIKRGETMYSINAIPFGGFVKILGENADEESAQGTDSSRRFGAKSKVSQIFVLASGVICNVLLAWFIISAGFMTGLPTSVDAYPGAQVTNSKVTVTLVEGATPADIAGFHVGDVITILSSNGETIQADSVPAIQEFIGKHGDVDVTVNVMRGKEMAALTVIPKAGIVEGRAAIGIAMDQIGTVRFGFFRALYEGAILTITILKTVTVGLVQFVGSIFVGQGSLSQVSGPVGIAGIVGQAQRLGLIYLMSFMAFISLNLAVINLIPFPALDGGRILFVIIESIKGKPIRPSITNGFNVVGFALLLILMVVVTYHDIIKLIH